MKILGQKGLRADNISSGGFTLLELLLYIGIFVVLAVAVSNIFIPLGRGRGNVVAQGEVHSAMNFSIERLGQDLREATSITTPNLTGDANSTATLALAHPTDGAITWCVNATRLRRAVMGATCDGMAPEITTDAVLVQAPVFTRWENTNVDLSVKIVSIEIDLTISYDSVGPDFQYSESKTTAVAIRQNLF